MVGRPEVLSQSLPSFRYRFSFVYQKSLNVSEQNCNLYWSKLWIQLTTKLMCAIYNTAVPLRRSILIVAGGIEDTRVSHSSSAQVRMVTEVTFHRKWIIQINAARRSITHFYQLYTYFNSIGGFSINIFSHWHSFVFAHQPFWVSMLSGTILHARSEDGGRFYFAWQDLGECWTIHSPPAFLSFLSLSLFLSR